MSVDSADSAAVGLYARCADTAAGLTAEMSWSSGEDATVLGAVTAKRQCFLTAVGTSFGSVFDIFTGQTYSFEPGFESAADNVRVWHDAQNWYLGGQQSGMITAKARCIDVSAATNA